MKVGTAGNIATPLVPGETRQLWAVATAADGSTSDVSNVAVWQSSDPSIASISTTGLLKAAIEGAVNVSATYQKVTGSLELAIEKEKEKPPVGCSARLDRPRLVYGAFGGSSTLAVTLTKSDCRWNATSDVSWLRISGQPAVSGTGNISYSVAANSTPTSRDGHLTIHINDGPSVVHDVSQEKPLGCSYVTSPDAATFTSAGGAGSFEVITTPGDCQWLITDAWELVKLTGVSSGTGRTTVTYSVLPNKYSFTYDVYFDVRGLSGLNPPGRHRVAIQPR